MKLKDMKIGTQMKIGFGIILFLILALGAISWYQTDKIAQQTEDIYDHPLTVRRTLGELNFDIVAMHRGMKDLCLAVNDSEFSKILQDIDLYQSHAFKQFDILYDRYLGDRKDIDTTYNDFVKWNSIRAETILLFRDGRTNEAIARTKSVGEGGSQVEILFSHLGKIDNFAINKGDEFYKNALKLKRFLNIQLLIIIIAILILAFLIVNILMRRIHQPLDELAKVTKLFKEGKTDVRSNYNSNNEFGNLSVSLNEMIEQIQVKTILDEKFSVLAALMLSEYDIKQFFQITLNALAEHTGSQMAAIYLLSEDKKTYTHFESIGMDDNARQSFAADLFEGEFGAVIATHKIQHIKNIPTDTRFTFYTVSGKFTPCEILSLPILADNEVVAIISLSSISKYTQQSIQLINRILVTLSTRVEGILAYHKMKEFTRKLELQNTELEAQKIELFTQSNELSEQNIELEMQKNQLDEANRLKSSFLSNMSHELRTPLNSVIALSGVLNRRLSGKVSEEESSYLDVIERNGKNLLLLINDILDISRIESGYEVIEVKKISVRNLIQEVAEMIEPQAQQKNISLTYHVDESITEINSDYEKCQHILQNLVGNAIKFTEVGSVKIAAEVKEENIHIVVSDTGIGISKEHLPHIFDEFRQVDSSNSKKYQGTGLGLAIAKKYAELIGGSLSVESVRGEGSRFTLSIPVNFTESHASSEVINPTVTSERKIEQAVGNENYMDKTILLVEDSEAIIVQLKEMLTMQGYNIMIAHNGNEALEQISHKIPDAMILDLMMPEVDGFEVLKRIREVDITAHLPVIILTAKYISKEELSFLKHNSIHQIIQKGDINKNQLLEAVARTMVTNVDEIQAVKNSHPSFNIEGRPLVLVIEDNADNMLTIKALLEGKCKVLEAEDGNTGVALAKEHKPHLILMDIALPDINGIEALKQIRKDNTLQHIPVIAVSASALKGDRENFIDKGFDGYIPKPIDNDKFEKVIKEWISV